jgi:serine/threonine protein kinase
MSLCINPQCPKPDNSDTILFCEACGSELLLKGRYRAMCKLGEGGFGITYEVTKVGSTVPEVLKVLTYDEPKAIELFQQEAKVLSELDHPGIPKVEQDSYFVYHPGGSKVPIHCFIMEKIVGMDLRQYMEKRGQRPIDQKLAIDWLKELVTILGKVHDKNFFHRDIKPPNIMMRSTGELVLIDFGTAREVTATVLEQKGYVTKIESEGYSPQEQLEYNAIPQSDFFALGRTFVALLTGKEPHDLYDSFHRELHWRNHVPEISPLLANLIDEMMAHKPSQRPANTQVILQRLSEIESKLYQPKPTSPDTKPTIAVDLPAQTIGVNSSTRSIKDSIGLFIFLIISTIFFGSVHISFVYASLFWGYYIFYFGWLTSIFAIIVIGFFAITSMLCYIDLAEQGEKTFIKTITSMIMVGIGFVLGMGLLFLPVTFAQEQFSNPTFNFSANYPLFSGINILLSFSVAALVSGFMLTTYGTSILFCLDEERCNSYTFNHFVIANISFVFAIITIVLTISIYDFKFQSASEYITVAIEFFAIQFMLQCLVLKYSLSQTWLTFLTVTCATSIGYYLSFNILGELIRSDVIKLIIGLGIFSIFCTMPFLTRMKRWIWS